MREKKIRLCLNSEEKAIVLDCLIDLRNRMIEEGKYTDCVDDMIIKIVQARVKRTRKKKK